jgi:hypothetical protein
MMVGFVTGCPRIDAAVAACVLVGADLLAGFLTAALLEAAGLAAGTFAFGFVLGRAGLFLALLFFVLTTEKFCFIPEIRGKICLPEI